MVEIRCRYSRETPLASTSLSPTRSRVRKVEAIPPRPLSRNSTRPKWVPTATMSSAPFSSASSIATSSLVPAAGNSDRVDAELADPLEAGRPAVGIGVDDHLGAAGQRVVADRVHVAEDHVGLVARLEHGVGAAVDADEHRPVLADVGPQHRQVLLVLVPADDDEHVPALDRGLDVRNAGAVEQEGALAAQEVHGVRRERLDLDGEAGTRVSTAAAIVAPSSSAPLATTRSPSQTRALVDPDDRPLLDGGQDVGPTSSIRGMPAWPR